MIAVQVRIMEHPVFIMCNTMIYVRMLLNHKEIWSNINYTYIFLNIFKLGILCERVKYVITSLLYIQCILIHIFYFICLCIYSIYANIHTLWWFNNLIHKPCTLSVIIFFLLVKKPNVEVHISLMYSLRRAKHFYESSITLLFRSSFDLLISKTNLQHFRVITTCAYLSV